MTSCICENHKDELKSLSSSQLGLKLAENIKIIRGMHDLLKQIIFLPVALKEGSTKDWLEENYAEFDRIEEFIEERIRNQQKIIDLLIEELVNRE